MKKWIGLLSSLFLILILGIGLVSGAFSIFKKTMPQGTKSDRTRMILVQGEKEGKSEETDPHLIQVLKEIQKTLDGWLKSLNERIESEDVTRLEVRFLEILRNILEWIKEKVDAQIESSEKGKPRKKDKGRFREIRQRGLTFSPKG